MTHESAAQLAGTLREKLFRDSLNLDAIVTLDPDHVFYLTGFRSMGHDLSRHYQVAAVITREDWGIVIGTFDTGAALELFDSARSIYRYGTFFVDASADSPLGQCRRPQSSFVDALRLAVRELVKPGFRVALDSTEATGRGLQLTHLFESQQPVDARPALLRSRRIKLDGEVARIRYAANLLEKGITAAFDAARAGVSECEIAAAIAHAIVAGGGIPRTLAVTSGPRAALVDAFPTARKLRNGDMLRLDLDCTFSGYWADMARTAFIGEPGSVAQERYYAISKALELERESIRPGRPVNEVFGYAVSGARLNGIPGFARHHCGHGIGVESHEFPQICATELATLEPGMVLCIETPYYQYGWGGVMREDMILVTAGGSVPITTLDANARVCEA